MDIIVQGMISLLKWLYGLSAQMGFENYGIPIILLTIIIKTIIFPLTWKQMSSMRQMADMQPKVQELQKKYKNDKQKLNEATMELYKQHNVNPASGCLPLLVQLPIFYGLYNALFDFGKYIENPSQAFFLGFDLTHIYGFELTYHILLPLLAGVTTFFQTKLSTAGQPPMANNPAAQTQKTMLYFMPVFFAYISATVPSGLALYWLTMNVVSILQQIFINNKLKKPATKAA